MVVLARSKICNLQNLGDMGEFSWIPKRFQIGAADSAKSKEYDSSIGSPFLQSNWPPRSALQLEAEIFPLTYGSPCPPTVPTPDSPLRQVSASNLSNKGE